MRSISAVRIGLALALLFALWSSGLATGKVAVDGLHGMPIVCHQEDGPEIDLAALYPDITFVPFHAARMPIYQILAEGYTQAYHEDTIEVDIPDGVHALYVALDIDYSSGEVGLPLPYIVCPDQTAVCGAWGVCHVDEPEAGHYMIIMYRCGDEIHYRVGTGPSIWEVYPPEDYDAILLLRSFDFQFLQGDPTPLSSSDFARLQQMLDAGGGMELFYEGVPSMVDKPIIRLRDFASQGATIRIDIPGRLTYVLPPPQSKRPLIWNIAPTSAEGEYDYEAALTQPLNFVARGLRAGDFVNCSWATVRDLKLIEFVRGEGYRIGDIGTLAPGEDGSAIRGVALPYFAACRELDEALRREALSAGMTDDEVESFFTKYSWGSRILADVCAAGSEVALYRIEGEDYDALLPLWTDPEPEEVCRVLWVYSMFPQTNGRNESVHPRVPAVDAPPATRQAGTLHEYGFMREFYGGDALDEMDAWGWHLYDLLLWDSTDYVEWPTNILFHTWGGSPLAARFSSGVNQVLGWSGSGILPDAGATEVVLSGDDDTYATYTDSVFPPGSYPPVVVARQEAAGGRLVGLSDLHFLADLQDNLQFMQNIFDWLDEGATGEGPDIDLPVAVAETTLVENSSGVTHFQVHNLGDETLTLTTELLELNWIAISGPSTIVIGPGGTVTYNLTWNSAGLAPGYYDTLWSFSSNDQNEPLLHWPVRLGVTRESATGEHSGNILPDDFALLSLHPNPFNGQASLSFAVPRAGVVLFDLYNVLGQHVERLPVREWPAGTHQLLLNLTGKPAGLYFLRAEFGGNTRIHKLMLVN